MAWLPATSITVDPARSDMARWAAGGIIRSWVVSRYQLGLIRDCLDDSARVRGAVQRSLMLRIKDYIDQRLCDPALGPAEIAAAVNISTRYLHKLFEAEHHTVALYIKGLRLDRARRDLLDPRLAGRPISTIAYACGFGDLSGFNRECPGLLLMTTDSCMDAGLLRLSSRVEVCIIERRLACHSLQLVPHM